MTEQYQIQNLDDLQAVIGEPMEFLLEKVLPSLTQDMRDFIARSPLVLLSTIDRQGRPDISPKGDPAGFVQVDEDGNLRIPERPGNRLTFGFRNILDNGELGLIFFVPNERETLRVKGRATLRRDPDILQSMAVRSKPALMFTQLDVTECFFHCGKALIRSRLWQPESWADPGPSTMVRQIVSSMDGDEQMQQVVSDELEKNYKEELY